LQAPGFYPARLGVRENESTGIGKKDLRQMQGDSPARRGARDLQQSQAQAAPGIVLVSLTEFFGFEEV
jgi:hypothetical protein